MTGMYQTSIGAQNHRSHREDGYTLPQPVKIFSDYFREAGYFVSNGQGTAWDKPGKTDFNFALNGAPFDGTDWRRDGELWRASIDSGPGSPSPCGTSTPRASAGRG